MTMPWDTNAGPHIAYICSLCQSLIRVHVLNLVQMFNKAGPADVQWSLQTLLCNFVVQYDFNGQ